MSNLFWHSRCEYLVARVLQTRLTADWKQIYDILSICVLDKQVRRIHLYALHNYDAMLVVEEIYGPIKLIEYMETTLFVTTDARLLERFIRESRTDLRTYYWSIFKCQLKRDSPALEYLISIVPELKKKDMTDILRVVLNKKRMRLLPFIDQYVSEDTDYSSLLLLATQKDDNAILKYVLQHYEPLLNELLDSIAECDSINILDFLVEKDGLEVDSLDYILDRAISSRSSKIIARIEQLQ